MKKLNWNYPKTLADAEMLVRQKNVLAHGGGTGLLLRNLSGVDGLIELSQLPLNNIKKMDNFFEIGSMCTYADVVTELKKTDPEHILVKSLHHSANTPLRNRITIGGSIAMFPPWSDLMGALIALDAIVTLVGKNNGDFPIEEYISDKTLHLESLIMAVKFQNADWRSAHYREIRTKSDMSTFNHTVLLRVDDNKISESRIVVVGITSKYTRLAAVEDYLNGRKINEIKSAEIEKLVSLKFAGSRFDDPEYSSIKAGIELGRLIQKMVRS
ncbi:FAD binding domain-containing protein [bacterium]|nr:FAD binding domain-containing protein [bacterium]MBU1064834.1 FAD binding domain-containing protein [bacterium]MBU1635471.1 FAD binding domain-containing protein [bacterium]MBU1874104.1 FAD binding domain-containing protein [bacterium]